MHPNVALLSGKLDLTEGPAACLWGIKRREMILRYAEDGNGSTAVIGRQEMSRSMKAPHLP